MVVSYTSAVNNSPIKLTKSSSGDLNLCSIDDGLVFSHLNGSPYLPDSVSHAFTKIARRAGLKGVRFHDLRHTHASLMLRQIVHPKVVQESLGHSTIAITLDTYSHVTPGLQEAAALKFDKELADTPPANGPVDKTQTAPLTIR